MKDNCWGIGVGVERGVGSVVESSVVIGVDDAVDDQPIIIGRINHTIFCISHNTGNEWTNRLELR